jgi:hypothetical protein
MKSNVYALPGILLVLALIACPSPVGNKTSYIVGGTITTSDNASAAGAQVRLMQSGLDAGEPVAVDEAGAYVFDDVEPGTYTIEVTLDGYDTGTIDPLSVPGDNLTGQDIKLAKAETPLPGTYTVSGTIRTSDNASAEGAQVQLRQGGEDVAGKTIAADSSGAYAISGVPEGSYTIEVSLAGYDTGAIGAFAVTGADITGKDLTLTKTAAEQLPGTYTVSGTISVSNGSPAGAKVQLRRDGAAVGAAVSAGTNGAYTIINVTAGTYAIEVSLEGYDTGTSAAFTVSGNVTGKDLTLTKAGQGTYTVHGTITTSDNASAAGAQVRLRQGGEDVAGKTAAADGSGAYAISDVAPGTYTIEVSLAGYDTGTIEAFTVAATVHGKNLTLTKTEVHSGTYTVSGIISTSDNASAEGAAIQLRQDGVAVGAAASAAADGAYTIINVEPGNYTIDVSLANYYPDTIASFTVSAANVTGKDLNLERLPYTVSGIITTDGDEPANGAKVVLRKSGETGTFGTTATTGPDGTYSIDLAGITAGHYYVKASLDGFAPKETTEELYLDGSESFVRNLRFVSAGSTLSGYVTTDYPGGPAVGARVVLEKKNGSTLATAYTNESGYYIFTNVTLEQGLGIRVFLDGYKNYYSGATIGPSGNASAQNPTLEANRHSIFGRISAEGGIDPYQADIILKQGGVQVGVTESPFYGSGDYEIEDVLPGNYTIEVSLSGYDTATCVVTVGSADLSGQNLGLSKTRYSVRGTISLSDGGNPSGVQVQLSGGAAAVNPDSTGAYTISGVTAGTYTITASLAGYEPKTTSSFTVSGNITGKNLVLRRYFTISGTVSLNGGSGSLGNAWVQLKKDG